jgi:hypothetical protein
VNFKIAKILLQGKEKAGQDIATTLQPGQLLVSWLKTN